MRIVWANGNERGGACGSGYHLTAPPACAKNHITVGALNSDDDSIKGLPVVVFVSAAHSAPGQLNVTNPAIRAKIWFAFRVFLQSAIILEFVAGFAFGGG